MKKKQNGVWLATPQIVLHDSPLSPTEPAFFYFDQYAASIARMIADKKTRTPLTIAISGQWGSGKTSVLMRIKHYLDETPVLADPARPALMSIVRDEEFPEKSFRVCRTVWFNA